MRLLKIKDAVPVYFNDNSLSVGIFAGGGGFLGLGSAPKIPDSPKKTDPEVEEAERKQKMLERMRSGRQQTILTGSTGLSGDKQNSILTQALR